MFDEILKSTRDYKSHASRYGRSKEFYRVLHKTGMKLTDREKGMIARFYVEAQKQGFPSVNAELCDPPKSHQQKLKP